MEASLFGLGQGTREDTGRNSIELGVQLNSCHKLACSRNLEVHVTQGIFCAEDVGESCVAHFSIHLVRDKTHSDTGNGSLQGNTGVQHRQSRRTHRTHGGGSVGAESLRHLANRVGEIFTAWQHGHKCSLCQETVPNFTTLRGAHATGLTGGVGREVVVVHVALGLHRSKRIDLLLQLQHVQGGNTHDLGLSTLEQSGTVNARNHIDLSVNDAKVGGSTAIDTNTLGQHTGAHDALGDGLIGSRHHGVGVLGEVSGAHLRGDSFLDASLQLIISSLTLLLVSDLVDARELCRGRCVHCGENLVGVVGEDRVVLDFLSGLVSHFLLSLNQLLQERLSGFQTGSHHILIGLRGAALNELPATLRGLSLHHHDGDVFLALLVFDDTTGNNDVKHGLSELRVLGESDPLVTDKSQSHGRDGTTEGQTRDLGGRASGVDCQSVIELIRGNREHRDHNLDLVAQTIHEGGAQWPVDQTADQDGLGRGATFTAEERSGDLSRSVSALFNVNGQGEEVKTLTGILRGTRCREQHGFFIQVCSNRTLGLLGQTTRFKAHGALSELAVIQNSFSELDFWTFH